MSCFVLRELLCPNLSILHIVLDSLDVMNNSTHKAGSVRTFVVKHSLTPANHLAELLLCFTRWNKGAVTQGAWSEVHVIVPKRACYDSRAKGAANSPINKFDQRLSARHWAVLPQQGVAEGLTQQKQDSWQSSEHKWVRMTLVRTCCGLISFQIAAAKNFAWESHWVKWKQSWDFCTFQVHKIEVLRHLRTLPTVPAMSVRDVCRWSVDLVIWLNVINVTDIIHCHHCPIRLPSGCFHHLSSPRCRIETAPGFSLWGVVMLHCGRSCLAALISSINKLNQHLFAPAGWCREWCHAARSQIGRCASFCCFKSETLDQEAVTHGWEWLLYALVT